MAPSGTTFLGCDRTPASAVGFAGLSQNTLAQTGRDKEVQFALQTVQQRSYRGTQLPLFRSHQDSERPQHGETTLPRNFAPRQFVYEDQIGLEFLGSCQRLSFSGIQARTELGYTLDVTRRLNDEKIPRSDIDRRQRGRRVPQFSGHSGRQSYLVEQFLQPCHVAQVRESPEWRCVTDDDWPG